MNQLELAMRSASEDMSIRELLDGKSQDFIDGFWEGYDFELSDITYIVRPKIYLYYRVYIMPGYHKHHTGKVLVLGNMKIF